MPRAHVVVLIAQKDDEEVMVDARVDFEALDLLKKAPSKNVVDKICTEVFKERRSTTSERLVSGLETALSSPREPIERMIVALKRLIQIAVYENSAELEPLFPASFHGDLKDLLLSIFDARLGDWRIAAQETQVSLPRYQGVDWRIDVKRASENVSSMAVPGVLVTVDVADDGSPSRAVTFELTKQSLAGMVDGMEKIKEQLGSLKQG